MSSHEIFKFNDDYAFYDFIQKRTFPELLKDYHYLKEKFEVVNTKYILKKYFKFLLEKEIVDLIHHYDVSNLDDWGWHFTDCPKISKEKIGKQQYAFCFCREEVQFPDCKFVKYVESTNAIFGEEEKTLPFSIGEKEDKILNFTEIHLEKYKDLSNYSPSDISNEVHTFRYFGNHYRFPTYYTYELKFKRLASLKYIRDNIASRLRYVNFLKVVEAADMRKRIGLKIVDGYWHVNECDFITTKEDDEKNSQSLLPFCDCNAIFDNPKGYLHEKYDMFDGLDTGYGLIKRNLFQLPI